MKFTQNHVLRALLLLSGGLLFIFVFMKANILSLTHDESYTYLRYPLDSFMEIISCKHCYTNNHILNSLFIKYSEKLFGNSELAIRLPNLLLLLVYMLYSYQLFCRKKALLSLSMFLLLCTNIALLDLFGLARGYGLSFGFMLMSFYHFVHYVKSKKKRHNYLFHFSALLAALSNFTLVTFYASILVTYNIYQIVHIYFVKRERFNILQINKAHLTPFIVVVIILYQPVKKVLSHGSLNFGGSKGFYADTVAHLIMTTMQRIPLSPLMMLLLKIVITLIVLIPLIIIGKKILLKNNTFFETHKELVISSLLMIVISTIIVLQHIIFNSDYPVSRFSVFLFPLFIIHFGFLVNYVITEIFTKAGLIGISCIALVSTIGFSNKANFKYFAEWGYDSETKNMIHTLISYHEKNDDEIKKIQLGVNWLFEPTINYYRKRYEIKWLLPANRNGVNKKDDYYYIFEKDLPKLQGINYEIIRKFETTKTVLLKNKTVIATSSIELNS